MKPNKTLLRTLAIAAASLLCVTLADAKKPDKPGPTSTRFRVQELPVEGNAIAISEVGLSGTVTVAIDSSDEGYLSGAFVRVSANNATVLSSGFLPEPPFVDPNDGAIKNGPSGPSDVNIFGDIVGYAAAFDPDAIGNPSPNRAILWSDDGSGYSYNLLPLLAGTNASFANGINNGGDVVGGAYAADQAASAVLWDAETGSVVDLNTPATADLGWELISANDINDDGLIVGTGKLNGVVRGFVLDSVSGSISPVPLLGPATSPQISEHRWPFVARCAARGARRPRLAVSSGVEESSL